MYFDWDRKKARANIAKHRIDFEEAKSAFGDPLSIAVPNKAHSRDEIRYNLIGLSRKGRLVVVTFTEQRDIIRIISARIVTKRERMDYEEG